MIKRRFGRDNNLGVFYSISPKVYRSYHELTHTECLFAFEWFVAVGNHSDFYIMVLIVK